LSVYTSKNDAWLIALLLVVGIVVIASLVPVLRAAPNIRAILTVIALPLAAVAFVLWVLLTTRYTLSDSQLLVRSGPLRWNIPLSEITAITPTHNPISSPAGSLDRLRIEYGNGRSLMISPKNKKAFLADVKQRQAALK
jgi:hypothetical protein